MDTAHICNTLASLLSQSDINEAVVSPGSRNAPIINALVEVETIKITPVVDERSAAFIALGKAMITGKCVILVCTSGTALLNYLPAIAEARYRHIRLLIISADRPHEWINRNDGQTLRQPGIFENLDIRSFNVSPADSDRNICNTINEALISLDRVPELPIHLNVEIDNPSINDVPSQQCIGSPNLITHYSPSRLLPLDSARQLTQQLSCPNKILVVAGCMQPSQKLSRTLSKLCSFGNWVVIADNLSNLHGKGIYYGSVSLFSHADVADIEKLTPDIIITIGGPIISSRLKQYLREVKAEHWHVGEEKFLQDTYGHINRMIETSPEAFFSQIVALSRKTNGQRSCYASDWEAYSREVFYSAIESLKEIPWSDLQAVTSILSMTPRSYNVQLSNGMTSRYAQVLPHVFHRIDCNRGVSGIDGTVSTALGAASEYNGNTLLLTGDMSAQYDIGALTTGQVTSRLKIVVISNGGGGIFNFIKGTRNHKITDRFLKVENHYNIGNVAAAIGFEVLYASDLKQLQSLFPKLLHNNGPAIMIVETDAKKSAEIMNQFLKRNKK